MPEVHSSSVTDLSFMSCPHDKQEDGGLVLLSVSVDKSCYVTEVREKGKTDIVGCC